MSSNEIELVGAKVGRPYEAQMMGAARDAYRLPATLTLLGGELPPGLSLSTDGVLAGTPGGVGDFRWTVDFTPADGGRERVVYLMSVAA